MPVVTVTAGTGTTVAGRGEMLMETVGEPPEPLPGAREDARARCGGTECGCHRALRSLFIALRCSTGQSIRSMGDA
jgi:hypothetical protein